MFELGLLPPLGAPSLSLLVSSSGWAQIITEFDIRIVDASVSDSESDDDKNLNDSRGVASDFEVTAEFLFKNSEEVPTC